METGKGRQNAFRRQGLDKALESDIIWTLRLESDLQKDLKVGNGISGKTEEVDTPVGGFLREKQVSRRVHQNTCR